MAAVPVSLGYGFRAGVSYSVFNEHIGFPVFTYILQCGAGKCHAGRWHVFLRRLIRIHAVFGSNRTGSGSKTQDNNEADSYFHFFGSLRPKKSPTLASLYNIDFREYLCAYGVRVTDRLQILFYIGGPFQLGHDDSFLSVKSENCETVMTIRSGD